MGDVIYGNVYMYMLVASVTSIGCYSMTRMLNLISAHESFVLRHNKTANDELLARNEGGGRSPSMKNATYKTE